MLSGFNPRNILILNFGQIGDIILSLPALAAVRKRFPQSKITLMMGKSGADIIGITDFADERIIVDRVKLLRSNKVWSIAQILKIFKDVRRRKFDFVIDLHSLYETNLLGFLSGAKFRLYANRENRSLDFLSKFRPAPPREDKKNHLTAHYLEVLKPLGIENAESFVKILPRVSDLETVAKLLPAEIVETKKLIGLFPGAGHPSRRWALENFAALAKELESDEKLQTIVFLGPEEGNLRDEVREKFPSATLILDKLTLPEFMAALSRLQVLISNDTSAVHIGAIAGTSIVLIMDERAPATYLPLTAKLSVVNTGKIDEIRVEEVLQAVLKFTDGKTASNENH